MVFWFGPPAAQQKMAKIYPSKPPFIVSKRREKYLRRRNPHYAWKLFLQLHSILNVIVLKTNCETKKSCLFFFTSTSRDGYTNPTPNFIVRSLDLMWRLIGRRRSFVNFSLVLQPTRRFLTEPCFSYFFFSQSPSDVNLRYVQLHTTLLNACNAMESFHCPRSLSSSL